MKLTLVWNYHVLLWCWKKIKYFESHEIEVAVINFIEVVVRNYHVLLI